MGTLLIIFLTTNWPNWQISAVKTCDYVLSCRLGAWPLCRPPPPPCGYQSAFTQI